MFLNQFCVSKLISEGSCATERLE